VGLVQREIETAGFSTITVSNIPDLTAAASVPRIAAIEYPFGLTAGLPGDDTGQRAALRATLAALQEMSTPGSVCHLPFALPESLNNLTVHPPENPPIAKYIARHPWQLPNLLRREVPSAGIVIDGKSDRPALTSPQEKSCR
jgi:hypothetical protein